MDRISTHRLGIKIVALAYSDDCAFSSMRNPHLARSVAFKNPISALEMSCSLRSPTEFTQLIIDESKYSPSVRFSTVCHTHFFDAFASPSTSSLYPLSRFVPITEPYTVGRIVTNRMSDSIFDVFEWPEKSTLHLLTDTTGNGWSPTQGLSCLSFSKPFIGCIR